MMHATTILCARTERQLCLGGDGQVSLGHTVMKHNAVKIRSLLQNSVLAGFAGSTSDALTLFDLFESALKSQSGHLMKASVDLAKLWRKDRMLRQLEAMMIVADRHYTFVLSGQGDVIEPDDAVVAIGSGGPYARSAALALAAHTEMSAEAIVRSGLEIASRICVYTNNTLTLKTVEWKD